MAKYIDNHVYIYTVITKMSFKQSKMHWHYSCFVALAPVSGPQQVRTSNPFKKKRRFPNSKPTSIMIQGISDLFLKAQIDHSICLV